MGEKKQKYAPTRGLLLALTTLFYGRIRGDGLVRSDTN